ncbi:MAG: tRNA (adenine-N1)-methyltransferase [Actinomycetaceae bacterium]|nr:tRNA (adenine-N1)-methyltransferase [Actinomycetaceae bacterium]
MTHQIKGTHRRGVFREGDRVQLSDAYGKMHTIILQAGGWFNVYKASFSHDLLLGQPEGTVVTSREGKQFLALRPLRTDYQLSMPRGATIVYPKDVGAIVQHGDIFSGAKVLEAGAGSGSLSIGLLEAVGEGGKVVSCEKRDDFAQIAQANVELYFGGPHPAWELIVGNLGDIAAEQLEHSFDRVILDMLDPWNYIDTAWNVLIPGGVFMCYVTTVTQLSRLAEDIKATKHFSAPYAWESMQRTWHLDGLAVRPDHSMIGHTGFLLMTRSLAQGVVPPQKKQGIHKVHQELPGQWDDEEGWNEQAAGQRIISKRKLKRITRDVTQRADRWLPKKGESHDEDEPCAQKNEELG